MGEGEKRVSKFFLEDSSSLSLGLRSSFSEMEGCGKLMNGGRQGGREGKGGREGYYVPAPSNQRQLP